MTTNTNAQDDPPPYTPTPAISAGESTLEHGPRRPSQSVLPNSSLSSPSPSTSLLRQLTHSLNNLIYPGQHEASLRLPNPLHPSSSHSPSASSSSHSPSPFVRDFYAAGSDQGTVQPEFVPPPGPPPRQAESISNPTPDGARPTTYPAAGHPLLNDGKVLVYPKGYKCHKCDNIGYKEADPSRPCRRCWEKYARPFSGPLAYSFSSNSSDGNFQRPLPPQQRPSIFEPLQSTPFPPHGFAGPRIIHEAASGPPTNAVVYTAGDPRIGGVLCWGCGGKGHVSFLFLDNMNCQVCNGVGRIFQ